MDNSTHAFVSNPFYPIQLPQYPFFLGVLELFHLCLQLLYQSTHVGMVLEAHNTSTFIKHECFEA